MCIIARACATKSFFRFFCCFLLFVDESEQKKGAPIITGMTKRDPTLHFDIASRLSSKSSASLKSNNSTTKNNKTAAKQLYTPRTTMSTDGNQ